MYQEVVVGVAVVVVADEGKQKVEIDIQVPLLMWGIEYITVSFRRLSRWELIVRMRRNQVNDLS